jgi:hypothetical protein
MDVRCPLCDYDLRGLIEPRCPECGYRFEWPDLLDPARRPHPYLFEHHPRRNVASFIRTNLGGLRPRRFWGGLKPAMPSRPGRLAAYALLSVAMLVCAPLVNVAKAYVSEVHNAIQARRQMSTWMQSYLSDPGLQREIARLGSLQAVIDFQVPPPTSMQYVRRAWRAARFPRSHVATVLTTVAWPWLTLAALMIFRWSMRRARVRTVHVLRCVVYGFDWGFWFVPILLLLLTADFAEDVVGLRPATSVPMLACVAIAAYGTYRIGSAYARYLRFDHPYLTALASQLIVGAVAASMLLYAH